MTFLPIVQRELRVAARRRSTFQIRWWAALIALGLSFVSLAWAQAGGNRGAGNSVFGLLTFYVFGLCLLAGVLLTADALSEEKRLGTLGLLFLTDLHGYDVVLGKFMAQWLSAFYCLLALLPALALPVLLGGVTGGEFWRMVLALSNMLFFSLALGLFVSALGRDSRKTMGNTLWLLLLVSLALPLLAGIGAKISPSGAWTYLNLVTPFSPFANGAELRYVRQPSLFWDSLLASAGLAFFLLALASLVLPRAWQERAADPVRSRVQTSPLRARNITPAVVKARGALLSRNPVLWLTRDQLGTQWGAWIVVLFWGILVFAAVLIQPGETMTPVLASYAVLPFGFCLKLLFGLQAGRLFAESRRNGVLELLLCTPLTSGEIIRGQMFAVARAFCWPLVAFVWLLFAPIAIHLAATVIQANWHQTAIVMSGSLISLLYTARFGIDLWALCMFAMGLSLSLKRPQLTPAVTIIFVLMLPSVLSFCLLDMLADIVFISWGANQCRKDLRAIGQ
ncbi:MAG TPA: ABC transporter permease subunit [Candidatus Limnocylindrales bacterium]|jgi:ABC-type transport system involved in multi-copper enzyme maturation permease subunit|nr:ABC transporter permease subunit [Candidatus Limnocylindrales bacterium]